MKSSIFLLAGCVAGITCYAQSVQVKIPEPAEARKLFVYAHVSLDGSYRLLNNRTGEDFISSAIETSNDNTVPGFGVFAGVGVMYRFTDRIALRGGLDYIRNGYRSRKIYLGQSYTVSYNTFDWVSIPVNVDFTIGSGAFQFVVSPGLSFNFLGRSRGIAKQFDEEGRTIFTLMENQTGDYRVFNLSPNLMAGVQYRINDRMLIRAMPKFEINAININREGVSDSIGNRLWSLGIDLSFFFGVL